MLDQIARSVVILWRSILDRLGELDQSKRTRFLAVAVLLTPLIIFTKWFAVIHGTFIYDDLDILLVVRTMPLAQSFLVMHGDVPIPLFRVFFSGMYALFGTKEIYWNLYSLLLTIAVHLTALAILVALGANLVVAGLFYLSMISASVWSYTAVGYYSMSIYPQIGLLGLIGVLAIIRWRSSGSANYKWIALGVSATAPLIHPSGAYVPVAVAAFAFIYQLGQPGARWSPLRMLDPEYRWLTIGLGISVSIFAIFFVFEVRNGPLLSMAHSPLSAYAIVRSVYFLVSQGMARELFKPFIDRLLRHADDAAHGLAAVMVALASMAAVARIGLRKRWTFLALLLPSLIIVTVVSFGRRLTSIDDVILNVGKYHSFAYLWFSLAMFYLAACLAAKMPLRWRETGGVIAIVVVGVLFVRYAREDNQYLADAMLRRQQRDSLVAIFANYAAKAAPGPMHIPTLDGLFIFPRYEALYKYNLQSYRPFLEGFDDRLTLLRNEAMGTWGMEVTQTVPSLRRATDPEFVRALEADHNLQSLYFGGVDVAPLPKARLDGAPIPLDPNRVSNTLSLTASEGSLSFATAGGASIMLLPDNWDPEQAHILTLRVSAVPDKPIPGEETHIEVTFEGQLPIPYSANKIAVPKEGGEISVDLLQLYSYSLNPLVGKLGLRFPRAGTYTISDVKLLQ